MIIAKIHSCIQNTEVSTIQRLSELSEQTSLSNQGLGEVNHQEIYHSRMNESHRICFDVTIEGTRTLCFNFSATLATHPKS